MPNFKQAGRLMQFTSGLGKDVLLIKSLEGMESMSRLFEFRAELLAETGTVIDTSKIVGTKVSIAIATLDSVKTRYINGVVAALEQTSGDGIFDVYEAHIVPSLWQLTLASNCRYFQKKGLMQIIKEVIAPYGLSVADNTSSAPASLDYVTQYNETDFNFISRLAEQYGVFYWFQHTEDDNKVTFGDGVTGYSTDKFPMKYAPQSAGAQDRYESLISDIRVVSSMVSGMHSGWDYDFVDKKAFGYFVDSSAWTKTKYEMSGFPLAGAASIKDKGQSSGVASNVIKRGVDSPATASLNSAEKFHGISSSSSLYPGSTLTLQAHPRADWNSDLLMLDVVHSGTQTPSYVGNDVLEAPYWTRFSAMTAQKRYSPGLVTPKPHVPGPQPALVTVTTGEEIQLDGYARVKVQFAWEKDHEADGAWVRVGQAWAGNGRGAYFWPRVGDEVLVQFMNGDPDDPVIIGSLYNGVNVPKYKLPDMSTMSGIVTRSSKAGAAANANELRFEDKKDSEEIYINAEKDMNVNVENDNYRKVGNNEVVEVKGSGWLTVDKNQHTVIKGALIEAVSGNTSINIDGALKKKIGGDTDIAYGGKLTEKTGGDYAMNVGGNHNQKVGMVYVVESGEEVHIKGGMKVVIESGMEVCLQGAGGFITIGPSGVAISGIMVMINSGGAAVPGTPAMVTPPQDPAKPADPPDGSWRQNS